MNKLLTLEDLRYALLFDALNLHDVFDEHCHALMLKKNPGSAHIPLPLENDTLTYRV